MKLKLITWLMAFLGTEAFSFVPRTTRFALPFIGSPSRLFGIIEWREQALHNIDKVSACLTQEICDAVISHVPVHLMDSKRVALPGERVYLQFTEYDDLRVFQQAIDCNNGVFGLGFVSNEGDMVYDKVSLVEIIDYNMMGDVFGVFLSCQVVGNAMVLDTNLNAIPLDDTGKRQPVIALCSEITNRVEKMRLADASALGKKVETLIAHVYIAEKERLLESHDDDNNRWSRYHEAYEAAFQSDSHGYTYTNEDSARENGSQHMYSWKQLNAISWAAFSTTQCLQQDHPYRLAALDNDCITNRLLLASYWLVDVLHDIKQGSAG